jgi:DNA gyrase inhibitor GyrI
VVAPEDVEGTAEVEIKSFPGGKYAVTRCHGILNIGEIWEALVAWREGSPYLDGSHQWLEKWVNPCQDDLAPEDMVFDLFMPIAD